MENATGTSPVLTGWKEIARYLNMGVRTVQRYEREHQLPVRRAGAGKTRGLVIASKVELAQWMAGRPQRELRILAVTSSKENWQRLKDGILTMRKLRDELRENRAGMQTALSVLSRSIQLACVRRNAV